MHSDDNDDQSLIEDWRDATPCCANVWDPILKAYRSCDEWADPASDSDLCIKHDERLTAIVSFINAAHNTVRMIDLEE
jgi:hypothetical protein